MTTQKTIVLSAVLVLLTNTNPAFAEPVKWKALSDIQKDVLHEHAARWNSYSESRQRQLLKHFRKEVSRKNAWKKWFHGLPEEERKVFKQNKKNMTKSEFGHYVDSIFEKYGAPH